MDHSAKAREIIQRYRHLRVGKASPIWRELETDIDRIIASGDYEQLVVLVESLEREPDDPFYLAKQRALNGLALIRTPAAVDAFLRLSCRPPSTWRAPEERYAWERAALLGDAQDLAGLNRALQDHASDASLLELLSCWIQECLLRGGAVAELDGARALWRRLEEQRHPLSWLPLELARCERDLFREAPRRNGIGNWFPFARAANPRLEGVPVRAPTPSAQQLPLEAADSEQITNFVGDELLYPNASFEVAAFDPGTTPEPVGPSARRAAAANMTVGLGSAVAALPLECLAAANRISAVEIAPRDAFSLLFIMATQGGAYARGRSAAQGRLRAWQCAGALAGARASSGFESAVRAVEGARWTFFDADSPWWYHVGIDFGLACVADDALSVRVLALTDTD